MLSSVESEGDDLVVRDSHVEKAFEEFLGAVRDLTKNFYVYVGNCLWLVHLPGDDPTRYEVFCVNQKSPHHRSFPAKRSFSRTPIAN